MAHLARNFRKMHSFDTPATNMSSRNSLPVFMDFKLLGEDHLSGKQKNWTFCWPIYSGIE